MPLKPGKLNWKTIFYILVLLAVAPFAIEFLFMAEFVGAEFAVTFMVYYFRNAYFELVHRFLEFKYRLEAGFDNVIQLAMFQPRLCGVSATASCVVIILTGSTLLACSLWFPAMLMSSGYI